jgi:hypothetical protein
MARNAGAIRSQIVIAMLSLLRCCGCLGAAEAAALGMNNASFRSVMGVSAQRLHFGVKSNGPCSISARAAGSLLGLAEGAEAFANSNFART